MKRCTFGILSILLLLAGCASSEDRAAEQAAKMARISAMSDFSLCNQVKIQDWPPTWRGGKGVFWYALEADYRNELKARGISPFLCSVASKRCVSFGYEFGSPAHRDCTVAEGGNVAAAQSERVRQKREEYQAIFGSGNQPNAKTQYEIQVEPYLVKPGRNTFCHSGGSYCTN